MPLHWGQKSEQGNGGVPVSMPSICIPALFDGGTRKCDSISDRGEYFQGKVEGISGVARFKGNAPSQEIEVTAHGSSVC